MLGDIDVIVVDRNGNDMECTIPRKSVSYYRGFITSNEQGKGRVYTMVYLIGSPNALKIVSTHNAFKEKMNAKTLNITGMSNEKVEKLKDYIEELREN